MRKGLVELTVVFLFAWLGFFFPPMRGMSPPSDVFVFLMEAVVHGVKL